MQVLQQLAVHTVLNGVHHLRLCLNGSPLLLYTRGKELSLEGNFFQHIQDLQHTAQNATGSTALQAREQQA